MGSWPCSTALHPYSLWMTEPTPSDVFFFLHRYGCRLYPKLGLPCEQRLTRPGPFPVEKHTCGGKSKAAGTDRGLSCHTRPSFPPPREFKAGASPPCTESKSLAQGWDMCLEERGNGRYQAGGEGHEKRLILQLRQGHITGWGGSIWEPRGWLQHVRALQKAFTGRSDGCWAGWGLARLSVHPPLTSPSPHRDAAEVRLRRGSPGPREPTGRWGPCTPVAF